MDVMGVVRTISNSRNLSVREMFFPARRPYLPCVITLAVPL